MKKKLIVNIQKEDEILDFGKPAIEGDRFDLSQPVTNLNQKVVVNLMARNSVGVKVEIASENETFAGLSGNVGGPGSTVRAGWKKS